MKYIFTITNCLFIIAAAYFCVDIIYKVALPENSNMVETQQVNNEILKTASLRPKPLVLSRAQNNAILKRNLFKVDIENLELKDDAEIEKDDQNLEPTHLKLVLWGTVTGGNEKFAVIEDQKVRQQSLYRTGDTIQGAELKQIFRHKVVLSFNGKDQVLAMKTDDKKRSKPIDPIPLPKIAQMPESIMPEIGALPANVNQLMRQIKFRPHFREGEPDGLMIYGIRPNSVFRKIGLRNGDIVKDVNGNVVSSSEDAAGIFSEVINSEQAKITLLRRGKIKELVYQMNDDSDL